MPAINFDKRFVDAVQAGEKRQTIRKKRNVVPGDTLQLYTGQRTKECKKIGEGECVSVELVSIGDYSVEVAGRPIFDLDNFAKADGLRDWPDIHMFFHALYGLPFKGILIKWRLL